MSVALAKTNADRWFGQTPIRDMDRYSLVFHDVFELFVANFYKYNLENWEVYPKKQFRWHEIQSSDFLPIMIPDITLIEKQSKQVFFMDTKFMSMTTRNQWGNQIYHSGHLYQIYTYVRSQEKYIEFHPDVSGILMYPVRVDLNNQRS